MTKATHAASAIAHALTRAGGARSVGTMVLIVALVIAVARHDPRPCPRRWAP